MFTVTLWCQSKHALGCRDNLFSQSAHFAGENVPLPISHLAGRSRVTLPKLPALSTIPQLFAITSSPPATGEPISTDGRAVFFLKRPMRTVILLTVSNVFMTFAWYGHLKFKTSPLWIAILASWLIAFVEYCFQVPANRIGHDHFSAAQLKIMQEVITLVVFGFFSVWYLREEFRWNYLVGFCLILAAVVFVFGFGTDTPTQVAGRSGPVTAAAPQLPDTAAQAER